MVHGIRGNVIQCLWYTTATKRNTIPPCGLGGAVMGICEARRAVEHPVQLLHCLVNVHDQLPLLSEQLSGFPGMCKF